MSLVVANKTKKDAFVFLIINKKGNTESYPLSSVSFLIFSRRVKKPQRKKLREKNAGKNWTCWSAQ